MNSGFDFVRIVEGESALGLLPELGQGYQFATLHGEATSAGHRAPNGRDETDLLVLNGEIGIGRDTYRRLRTGDKPTIEKLERLTQALNTGPITGGFEFEVAAIRVSLQQDRGRYLDFVGEGAPHDRPGIVETPLHGSPPFRGTTSAGDCFYRFTAFRNDFRVGPGNSLVPGSYATSRADRGAIVNALAAVGRYALPNPVPPVHVFAIRPLPGTRVLYGTVASNHGQGGGGVEVEFLTALPPDSVVYEGTISVW